MQLLSKVRQKTVLRTLLKPTFYETCLVKGYIPNAKPPKQSYEAHEVLLGEPRRRRQGQGPLQWTRFDEYLQQVGNVGKLRVYKNRFINVQGTAVYLPRCNCGNRIRLTAQEIIARNRDSLGCCGPRCDATPVATQIYHCPEVALRLQLCQLVARRPNYVDSEWTVDFDHSIAALNYDATPQFNPRGAIARPRDGRWWLQGIKKNGLKSAAAVDLGLEPDKWILPVNGIVARWEGKLFPLEELSASFNVPMDTVLRLRLAYFDGDLIDALLGEQS